jgi:predicted Zn-dependent peptidase
MADSLILTTERVIRDIQVNGIDPDILDKVKAAQKQARAKAEQENSYWMAQLRYRYEEKIPLEGAQTEVFLKQVNELSLADIQKAAQDYFPIDGIFRIILMPESHKD